MSVILDAMPGSQIVKVRVNPLGLNLPVSSVVDIIEVPVVILGAHTVRPVIRMAASMAMARVSVRGLGLIR